VPLSELISSAIWIASSLVGAMMTAWITFLAVSIFSITGMANAAVLPVPVCACQMIFFVHPRSSGIHASWIGDGVSNHFVFSAAKVEADSPISENFIMNIQK